MGTSETSESASKCFHCPNRMNSRNNLRAPPSPHVSRVVAVDADDRSLECKGFDMYPTAPRSSATTVSWLPLRADSTITRQC